MLKYLYCKEVFSEIPSEISLGISITGCTIKCPGCHSRDLWIDNGIILGMTEFQWLLNQHSGITCVCLLGGEHDIDALTELFMYAHQRVKTAWYCGLDEIPKDKLGILRYLDYVKIGRYDQKLGPLTSPTTNQHLYKVTHTKEDDVLTDITSLFWHSSSSPS
jgi:anaerobic ribonucleoside-triphosphate reductase activating protein